MRTGQSTNGVAADMKLLQKVDLTCEELRKEHIVSLGIGGVRVRTSVDIKGPSRVSFSLSDGSTSQVGDFLLWISHTSPQELHDA